MVTFVSSQNRELRQLVEETFDPVEEHLPKVDLKPQRETFNRLYPRWKQNLPGVGLSDRPTQPM